MLGDPGVEVFVGVVVEALLAEGLLEDGFKLLEHEGAGETLLIGGRHEAVDDANDEVPHKDDDNGLKTTMVASPDCVEVGEGAASVDDSEASAVEEGKAAEPNPMTFSGRDDDGGEGEESAAPVHDLKASAIDDEAPPSLPDLVSSYADDGGGPKKEAEVTSSDSGKEGGEGAAMLAPEGFAVEDAPQMPVVDKSYEDSAKKEVEAVESLRPLSRATTRSRPCGLLPTSRTRQ